MQYYIFTTKKYVCEIKMTLLCLRRWEKPGRPSVSLQRYFHLTTFCFFPASLQSCYEEESELQACWILHLVYETASTISELYVAASGKKKMALLRSLIRVTTFPPASPSPMMLWFAA